MKRPLPERLGLLVGALVFAVGLAIRGIGIGWGLPNDIRRHSYHPDEPIVWAYAQQIDPIRADFDPGFYNYGTLYLTVLRVATDVVQVYGGSPNVADADDLAQFIGRSHLAGRWISALAGAGTALVVFLILKRRTSMLGAAFGGGLLAVGPAHVIHSRFQTVDILATFFIALSLHYALKLVPDEDSAYAWSPDRSALLAGTFAGLAAGTKYTAALVILSLYFALFVLHRQERWRRAALGTAAAAVFFLIATPGVLLNWPKFSADFKYEMGHSASGHGLVFVNTPTGYFLQIVNLGIGIGFFALLMGGAALLYAAYKRRLWALTVLAFAIPYYLLIGGAEVKFLRYTFPLFVAVALGFGYAIGQARNRGRLYHWLVIAGIILVGGALGGTAKYTAWMAQPDPRDQAGRALRSLARTTPTSVGVINDPWFWTAALYKDVAMPRPQWQREGLAEMAVARDPSVVRFDGISRPDYVVISSLESYDLERLSSVPGLSPDVQSQVDVYKSLKRVIETEYEPFARYGGGSPHVHDIEYIHPEVKIWKRKSSG